MTDVATIPDPFAQPPKASTQMSPSARAAVDDNPNVKRDGFGRYLLPTGKDGKDKPYTRATTFAKSISDTFTLSAWSQRMAIKGITLDAGLYAAVASTPLSDRDGLNRLAEQGKERAGAKTAASIGTALHAFTEQADRGELPDLNVVPPLWRRGITAYLELLDASGFEIDPDLIERIVLEDEYEIAGTFDRIVRASRDVVLTMPDGTLVTIYEGEYVVLDLKTGRDLSYGWNEIVIQLALYAHARTMLSKDRKTMTEKPVTRLDVALVIHLPAERITEEEAQADLYAIDIAQGWAAVPLCAAVRRWRKVRKLAVPIAHATVNGQQAIDSDEGNQQTGTIKVTAERVPVAEVKLMKPTTQAHIDACTTEKELRDLVHDLRIARQFTPDAEAYAQARLAGIRADTAPA